MHQAERYRSIAGDELYRRLAMGEPVVVLDVRTSTEHREGHIPGALLIPMQELDRRLEEIPRTGAPVAVVCEEGNRGPSACGFLAEHGLAPLYHLDGGLRGWPGPVVAGRDDRHHVPRITPSAFLVENFGLLRRGLALDVAMGEGRNAIYLATRGFDVDGVDANPDAVARARIGARRLGSPIRAIVGNFEDGSHELPTSTYDLIAVFNYLHRPLFDAIREAVAPGGRVIYQTYTVDQARFGRPSSPDHLLRPGELQAVFGDWETLRYREFTGPDPKDGRLRAIAGIVARKPD